MINEEKDTIKIFLAGTIDNGNSKNWQREVVEAIQDENVIVFNPRRDDWDKAATPQMQMAQIAWEQEHLEEADIIFMVIRNDSLSPISLLELGEYCRSGKIVVFCEEYFWRYWNVLDTCNRFEIPLYENTSTPYVIKTIKEILSAQ